MRMENSHFVRSYTTIAAVENHERNKERMLSARPLIVINFDSRGGGNDSRSSRRKTPRVYKFWYRSRKYFFDLCHEYREKVLPSSPGAFANGSSVV